MTGPRTQTRAEHFWRKVQKGRGCWLWTGARRGRGYGVFWDGKRVTGAHEYALVLDGRPRPSRRADAMHWRCDNPPCVRAAHLKWGTRQDNVDDAVAKRRHAHGESHGGAKLTTSQATEIRRRVAAGEQQKRLAAEYRITQSIVSGIVHGRRWRDA